MQIDDKLLEKLEKLSALKVPEDKKEAIKGQISEILNFVENLNAVDLSAEIPHKSAKTPMREDTPRKSEVVESILKNAPKAEGGFFIVPKIIE
ncbi:Asp-tRNA(Asn)/Glu-tRNA(Gln) amidotransferase subunit GatC [Helicobacter sp. 23-1044]